MKKTLLACCALALTLGAQAQWKPVGDKIKTPWAEQVNPANVLPEYPRPQLERGDWQNLNGEWEYVHQTGWRCRAGNIRWQDFGSFCCRILSFRRTERSWRKQRIMV